MSEIGESEKDNPPSVSKYWDEHVGKHLGAFENWEANAPVMLHQNFRVSGDRDVLPLTWFMKKYGPFANAASTGSGTGLLEHYLASTGMVRGRIVGYDISPTSLEVAAKACQAYPNVEFHVADLNQMRWDRRAYHTVLCERVSAPHRGLGVVLQRSQPKSLPGRASVRQ